MLLGSFKVLWLIICIYKIHLLMDVNIRILSINITALLTLSLKNVFYASDLNIFFINNL